MSDMPFPPPVPPPGTPGSQEGFGTPAGLTAGSVPATRDLGKRRSLGLVILLTIVTCGVWAVVWAYQTGDELQRWSGKGLGGVVHLIVTILAAPVTMFLLAGEVEQLYRAAGREPPITTIWGLWFLLPLIGNIIWYVRIQEAINDYWTAFGQDNTPGL
ncbi:MAG: DUF4234 domain-containing protein [Ilumatobacteraceae bacterium]